MRKLTFDGLETEIKALIIEQILRPTDLKSLCLVNKQLHEIAVKPLYRYISLDLGSVNDIRLSAFLNPGNKGLRHVRQIRLNLASVRDSCNQKQQADFATRMLLEFLPEDVLEKCSWCPWEPFATENLLLLYRKQRRLKWLEVMHLDREVLPELKKNTKLQAGIFSHARRLAIYAENRQTLDLGQFYVQKMADVLENLIVDANFHSHDAHDHLPSTSDHIDARELNDSATAPGLITRTVFSHMLPFDQCTPFQNLKALRLHQVNLRYCADTWCHFVKFTNILFLRLFHCAGVDSLFSQLCKAAHLPKRLIALELRHKDNAENEALMALDGFLCLVSGVEDLVIDLEHVKALPAVSGIARHAKTLEYLNVHCSVEPVVLSVSDGDTDELTWSTEDFEKICKACTCLQQLSCAWPTTSLIRSPSTEWQAYENALVHTPHLVTLHISTFPTNKPSGQLLPRAVYEQLLQCLACSMFESAATDTAPVADSTAAAGVDDNSPPIPDITTTATGPVNRILRLIAFGIADENDIHNRQDSKNQLLYLRSTCLDALGVAQVYAAPIGWCLRQFVEPRSEVLEYTLKREARMPCRESSVVRGGGGWGGDEAGFDDI